MTNIQQILQQQQKDAEKKAEQDDSNVQLNQAVVITEEYEEVEDDLASDKINANVAQEAAQLSQPVEVSDAEDEEDEEDEEKEYKTPRLTPFNNSNE